ncbi:MAG: hypothetical protein WBC04_10660 [Candidatus Acidiferrales bacterium]
MLIDDRLRALREAKGLSQGDVEKVHVRFMKKLLRALPRMQEWDRRLPWGLEIAVDLGESIGWSVYTCAIYETAVTKALWRLVKPGDSVVDGGANIGYMTSILAEGARRIASKKLWGRATRSVGHVAQGRS